MDELESPANHTDIRPWGLRSGHLALDFANTADWHASPEPEELLKSYADLLLWAQDFEVLTAGQAGLLLEASGGQVEAARAALGEALLLRETIYRIFSAVALHTEVSASELERLNRAYARAITAASIEPAAAGFNWIWPQDSLDLTQMLPPIVVTAVDLLRSADLGRIGRCADDRGCGFLFFDTSRNRSRQWCRMGACGNRAKAKRHYRRRKNPHSA